MRILGFDPGITGAIAVIGGGRAMVYDMPIAKLKKGKNAVMAAELWKLCASLHFDAVYCEQVSAMPGQGVSSAFSFGRSLGVIEGVAASFGKPFHLVTPQRWKKHFGLIGTDKDAARTIASQLFPEAELSRKKDIGRADALLIARYGWEQAQAMYLGKASEREAV